MPMGTYCNLKTLLWVGEGGGDGAEPYVWEAFSMESNGALHWEMMKKVEQKARSLHEL